MCRFSVTGYLVDDNASNEEIVANLRNRISSNHSIDTRRDGDRPQHRICSLCELSNSLVLPGLGVASGWDAQTSKKFYRDEEAEALAAYLMATNVNNVTSVACAILNEFGSLGAMLFDDESRQRRLSAVAPQTQSIIEAMACLVAVAFKKNALSGEVIHNRNQLFDYLFADMAYRPIECFRTIFLCSKHGIIADEIASRGTINEAAVYPRSVVKRALDLGAKYIVIVHNHPSGDPEPSKADVSITRDLTQACRLFDITVDDHIIVAKSGLVSLREKNLL